MQGLSQTPESLLPEGPSGFHVTSYMGSRLEGRFTGACACVRVRVRGCGRSTRGLSVESRLRSLVLFQSIANRQVSGPWSRPARR